MDRLRSARHAAVSRSSGADPLERQHADSPRCRWGSCRSCPLGGRAGHSARLCLAFSTLAIAAGKEEKRRPTRHAHPIEPWRG